MTKAETQVCVSLQKPEGAKSWRETEREEGSLLVNKFLSKRVAERSAGCKQKLHVRRDIFRSPHFHLQYREGHISLSHIGRDTFPSFIRVGHMSPPLEVGHISAPSPIQYSPKCWMRPLNVQPFKRLELKIVYTVF